MEENLISLLILLCCVHCIGGSNLSPTTRSSFDKCLESVNLTGARIHLCISVDPKLLGHGSGTYLRFNDLHYQVDEMYSLFCI